MHRVKREDALVIYAQQLPTHRSKIVIKNEKETGLADYAARTESDDSASLMAMANSRAEVMRWNPDDTSSKREGDKEKMAKADRKRIRQEKRDIKCAALKNTELCDWLAPPPAQASAQDFPKNIGWNDSKKRKCVEKYAVEAMERYVEGDIDIEENALHINNDGLLSDNEERNAKIERKRIRQEKRDRKAAASQNTVLCDWLAPPPATSWAPPIVEGRKGLDLAAYGVKEREVAEEKELAVIKEEFRCDDGFLLLNEEEKKLKEDRRCARQERRARKQARKEARELL